MLWTARLSAFTSRSRACRQAYAPFQLCPFVQSIFQANFLLCGISALVQNGLACWMLSGAIVWMIYAIVGQLVDQIPSQQKSCCPDAHHLPLLKVASCSNESMMLAFVIRSGSSASARHIQNLISSCSMPLYVLHKALQRQMQTTCIPLVCHHCNS